MKKLLTLITIVLLTSCTIEGKLDESDKNKLTECIDTRDGEVFIFNTNTITNVRLDLINSTGSFDIITLEGIKKTLNSNSEIFLKCTEKDKEQ